MISHLTNLTGFTNGKIVLDISQWEGVSIQVIGGIGTISILGSNNPGDITGVTDGEADSATSFVAVQAVNLSAGTSATVITTTDIYRIAPTMFKFLQIGDGSTAVATKILVFKTKPY